jgi:hypothetical protein
VTKPDFYDRPDQSSRYGSPPSRVYFVRKLGSKKPLIVPPNVFSTFGAIHASSGASSLLGRTKMNSPVFFDDADGNSVQSRLLRRSEAAQYVREKFGIPLSQKTLSKLAVVGGGPLFRKAGRFPLYEIADRIRGRARGWGRNSAQHLIGGGRSDGRPEAW